MKKGILVAALILTVSVLVLSMGSDVQAVSSDCTKCHGEVVSNFDLPAMNRGSNCNTCHGGGRHAYWYDSSGYLYYSKKITGIGYFKTAESVYAPPAVLHQQHAGRNDWAGKDACKKCHQVAACTSCHNSVNHGEHSLSEYTAASFMQGDGITYSSKPMSCAMSECHYQMPNVTRTRKDGSQLCLNCHLFDFGGHNQETLDNLHLSSSTDRLKMGDQKYAVSCEGCHANNLTTEHKNAAINQNMPEDTECGYCHGATVPGGVGIVVSDIKNINSTIDDSSQKAVNRDCLKCHFNAAVLPEGPPEHAVYHIAVGSDNMDISGQPHQDCNTCHADSRLFSTIAELAKTPVSQRDYDCFICHNGDFDMEPIHTAAIDGEGTEIVDLHPGCSTCHAPGSQFSDIVSGIITDIESGADSYDCMECHSGEALDEGHAGIIDSNCTKTCHKAALTEEHLDNPISQAGNQDEPLSCGTCHNTNDVQVRVAITTGNTDCTACHNFAHNFNIIQQAPNDIPLYPGFQWSSPQSAEIWAGEPWMPDGYEGAMLLISNRRTDVTREGIWNYYKQEMSVNGWTLPSVNLATDFFTAEFVKNKRKVTIFFYGGENHATAPVVTSGYRLKIMYK